MLYIYSGDYHVSAITDKINADDHSHQMLQISVSLRDNFRFSSDGNEFLCQGIIINSNIRHSMSSNGDPQLFYLIDNSSILAKQFKQKYLNSQPFHVMDEDVVNSIRRLSEGSTPILNREDYRIFHRKLFETLQIDIHEHDIIDDRIKHILDRIQHCSDSEHHVEDLARGVFLSKSRLSHLFKKEVGVSLSSYIVLHKLQKALFYIFSGKSITTAAVMAGFDSASHFAAANKRILGMSARELQEDSMKNKFFMPI